MVVRVVPAFAKGKSLWRVKINLAKARVLSTLYVQVARKLILLFIVYPNIHVIRSWIMNQVLSRTTQMHIQIGNQGIQDNNHL